MKPVKHNLRMKVWTQGVFALLALCWLGFTPTSARSGQEAAPAFQEDFRTTQAALVWVVGKPTEPRASLIRKLPKGAVVSVLSTHEAWVRVAIVDGTGQGGYVLDSLLTKANQRSVDAALSAERNATTDSSEQAKGVDYGTHDDASGYRQANVPKVWIVGDPEHIYESLIVKLDQGDAVRVLSQGETWSKVQVSGSGRTGYVMNRWTIPASFKSMRAFVTPSKEGMPRLTKASDQPKEAAVAPPVKAPYLIKNTAKKAAVAPKKQQPKTAASLPKTTVSQPVVKLAGIGMPELPFKSEEAPVEESAKDAEKEESLIATGLLIAFILSAIGLFIFFVMKRSKYLRGDGAMDCLGKIRIDSKTVLTLVRVPGKLLVMLKTPEGVDILREIKTTGNVAPAQARQILQDSFVGRLPTKTPQANPFASAAIHDMSPAEALAMRGSAAVSRRSGSAGTDPLQQRLGSARDRMRTVMGMS
jgi:flagellar biogenesis protein FliO